MDVSARTSITASTWCRSFCLRCASVATTSPCSPITSSDIYCASNRVPLKRLDPEVIDILEEYAWNGNVRELENLIQRLVLMVPGPVVLPRDLPQQLLYASTAKQESLLIPEEGIDFDEEIARIEVAYLQAALRRAPARRSAPPPCCTLTRKR